MLRRVSSRSWAVAAGVAAGIIVLFGCALRQAQHYYPNSDGASNVLQAWAMLHGNLLLHGWYLSDVSFYTTELPEYALVALVRGLRPSVVQVSSALTFTLLVVLAALVARGRARGRDGLVRAAVPVVVMLGPTGAGSNILLNDLDHTGTAAPVLLALLLIDRFPGRRWVPAAVAAVLGWALAGDSLVLLIGVAPLVAVCGAWSFRRLALRGEHPRVVWYELSLTAAGLAATAAGFLLTRLIAANGGFALTPSISRSIVPSTEIPRNTVAAAADFFDLYSGSLFGQRVNGWLIVTGVHAIFGCAVALALLLGLRRFFRGADLLTRLLVTAIVLNLLGYVLLYRGSGATAREIAPVFSLGAALAGRVLGAEVTRRRLQPLLAVAALASIVVLCCTLVTVRPGTPVPAELASFLQRHDLRSGVGGYWQADSTTLASGGLVTVRSVKPDARGLKPYLREIDSGLFDSQTNDANFFVTTTPESPAASVTTAQAIHQFGKPYRRYRYLDYVIMVWRKNLLAELPKARPPD